MEQPVSFRPPAQDHHRVKFMRRHLCFILAMTLFTAFAWHSGGPHDLWADSVWAEDEPAEEAKDTEAAEEGEADGGAEGFSVRLNLIEGELPADDPMASAWDDINEVEFNLSPQVHWPDRLLDATVKSVKVRGYHDGERMAILVEYEDPTEDAADAAALEFMVER